MYVCDELRNKKFMANPDLKRKKVILKLEEGEEKESDALKILVFEVIQRWKMSVAPSVTEAKAKVFGLTPCVILPSLSALPHKSFLCL
ncbi:hypothetical protein CEXT_245141 [Caerostris extrusa]|uniref:Uncharacterized protein n=1 Tax=Caerostris extrusa TaxID=172846 RepID=A0AAV4XIW2_CAEEX|nr:hypothetical protein CEXT_245141 [Caerostris extrusa]